VLKLLLNSSQTSGSVEISLQSYSTTQIFSSLSVVVWDKMQCTDITHKPMYGSMLLVVWITHQPEPSVQMSPAQCVLPMDFR